MACCVRIRTRRMKRGPGRMGKAPSASGGRGLSRLCFSRAVTSSLRVEGAAGQLELRGRFSIEEPGPPKKLARYTCA